MTNIETTILDLVNLFRYEKNIEPTRVHIPLSRENELLLREDLPLNVSTKDFYRRPYGLEVFWDTANLYVD